MIGHCKYCIISGTVWQHYASLVFENRWVSTNVQSFPVSFTIVSKHTRKIKNRKENQIRFSRSLSMRKVWLKIWQHRRRNQNIAQRGSTTGSDVQPSNEETFIGGGEGTRVHDWIRCSAIEWGKHLEDGGTKVHDWIRCSATERGKHMKGVEARGSTGSDVEPSNDRNIRRGRRPSGEERSSTGRCDHRERREKLNRALRLSGEEREAQQGH